MLLLAIVALMAVSCTSGKERKIVGIWETNDTQNFYYQHSPKYLEFKKDGTVIINESTAFNYKIVDDDLIIRSEWASMVFKIEKLTKSELRLYSKEEGTIYYDKINEITPAMRFGYEIHVDSIDSLAIVLEKAAAVATELTIDEDYYDEMP